MRALCLLVLAVAAVTYASAQDAGVEASTIHGPGSRSKSFVISVDHQVASSQPYPRGANSKQVSITVGTGSAAVAYKFTVDTGSAVLLLTCKTPTSTANCNGNLPASSNYVLTPDKEVTGAATCSVNATGIGCLLPNNKCFISEPLTGNPGYYNINNGLIAHDTVTVQNVLSGGSLSFPGLFGCAEAYIKCTPANPNCFNQTTQCPAAGSSSSNLFDGTCPGSGNGIEAGWTFNVGGAPSAMAVPEQIYQAGLISKKVTGFCYQRPQKDTSCSLPLSPNSAIALGPALPRAIASTTKLQSAPLIPAVFPPPMPGSAAPYTHTFRSLVNTASVPVFGNQGQPWTGSYEGVSVLWDTGAYGQSTIPTNAYNAFRSYYVAASAAAKSSAVATISSRTPDVAVCPYFVCASFDGGYFWLARPWFAGRFVQFDSSAPAAGYPSSTGTVYWSDPISSCAF
ncbi:hypothetical protein OEZ85_000838 [Tetradesmus obliquus]|uniref:Peptidase A1 domain-containing protein n=1 Tax=Tetradesmus obliquus TaxID=3088 RepID=A0ABY8UMQ4_TETOB|nr:hypothetical protein OEZ85_000838 [Tetradesmus obliquus]